jgi:hypothetical protein
MTIGLTARSRRALVSLAGAAILAGLTTGVRGIPGLLRLGARCLRGSAAGGDRRGDPALPPRTSLWLRPSVGAPQGRGLTSSTL